MSRTTYFYGNGPKGMILCSYLVVNIHKTCLYCRKRLKDMVLP